MAGKDKTKKWKFTVELPVKEGCTEKLAKEKVCVAVAAAFSLGIPSVKVGGTKARKSVAKAATK